MKSLARPALLAFALGVAATVSQVLTIREQLVAFTGNELTVAVTISAWMLMVAAGSAAMRRLARDTARHTANLFIVAGLCIPFQVVSIRLLHNGQSFFGEATGPGMVMVLSVAGVLPSAAILGALFVAVVGEVDLAAEAKAAPGAVPLAYGLESLGSAFAGLILAVFLLDALDPVAVSALAGLVAVAAAGLLLAERRGKPGSARIALVVLPVAALALALGASSRIDKATRQFQWRPLKVEKTVDSKYGNLVVAARSDAYDLYETGMFAFTIPDPLFAEETAHLPLLVHPEPHDVLVIGGAGSGAIGEISKHRSVRSIDYVETDPVLIEAIKPFAPPGWMEPRGGVALNMIYGDARRYVSGATKMYDVVIISAGPPTSLQINRFYTVEFLRSAERVLNRNGVLAMKIGGQGAYLSPETAALILSLKGACKAVFRRVIVLPGDYIHVLASPGLDLDSEVNHMMERLGRRGITAAFTNQYLLWDRLSAVRRAEIDSVLASSGPGRVNSDLRPEAMSAEIKIWERHFRSGRLISGLADRISPLAVILAFLVVGLATALSGPAATRPERHFSADLLALYAMGLATMATQVLVILAVQITAGYVYTRIAAIVASFMLGMGLASLFARFKRESLSRSRLPEVFGALLAVPPLAVVFALRALTASPQSMSGDASDVAFAGIAFATGALGGLVFAQISSRMRQEGIESRTVGAASYSADLVGAAAAGLTTGLLLVPGLGLVGTAYSIAAFDLVATALIVTSKSLSRARRLR